MRADKRVCRQLSSHRAHSARLAARVLACGLLLTLLPSCTSVLKRPRPSGAASSCVGAPPPAAEVLGSLSVVPYRPKGLYDLNAKQGPVRLRERPCADCVAVRSYPNPRRHPGAPAGFERLASRSFTYDNALTALLAVAVGRRQLARRLLDTLVALQRTDGGWGFSFQLSGDGFYNEGYVRAGVVAWALYAMARYAEADPTGRYRVAMRRAGRWLLGHQQADTGLIRGGQGRWTSSDAFEPGYRADWVSTEHNVDAYFAVRAAAVVDPQGSWPSVGLLGAAIHDHLWVEAQGRFARGLQGGRQDLVTALDASGSWSALFALATSRPLRAQRALRWVHQRLGFRDGARHRWRPDDRPGPPVWFVEATVAIAMAHARLGERDQAKRATQALEDWVCATGLPMSYSDRWRRDHPKTPAVAPTAWWALWVVEQRGGAQWLWRAKPPGR